MPLTPDETAFLGPTLAEYMDVRLGPAWTVLRDRRITYRDVTWLMEAYLIARPPQFVTVVTPEGESEERLQFGTTPDPLPACPWPHAESARHRNAALESEVMAHQARRPA